MMPTASKIDRCIVSGSDGADAIWIGGEGVPGVAASFDDGPVVVVDAVGKLVLAQVLTDVFLGTEFGRIGRQVKQADVVVNV